jgi:hypothetical protein
VRQERNISSEVGAQQGAVVEQEPPVPEAACRSHLEQKQRAGATMGKDSSICLGCSKKFSKSDTLVQCTVSGLWIHKICPNMSDKVIDLLEKQKKENGITYWACRP